VYRNSIFFKAITIFSFIAVSSLSLLAQADEVNKNLRLYAHGQIDEVKNNLLDLLVEYPDDPGVKLLRAVVEDDAEKALKMYQNILNNYSKSDWADYAYWRIIQYYAITGDISKAEEELENFRLRYPSSVFLGTSTDLIITAKSIQNNSGKSISKRNKIEDNSTAIHNDNSDNNEVPKTEDVVFSNPSKDNSDNNEELSGRKTVQSDESKSQVADESEQIKENESGYWGLQVGIYQNKDSAEKEREKFLTKRLRTKIEEKEVNGKVMYAVVIGNYTSEASAEAAKMIVKQQCDCNPIIYKK
jgi:tetratricopeptide (TPR) repeat protein